MPSVLGVPKTTLSFNDLLEGRTRFRNFHHSQLPLITAKGSTVRKGAQRNQELSSSPNEVPQTTLNSLSHNM